MKKNSLGMLHWLWLSTIVFIFDQLAKHAVVKALYLYEQLPVIPSFFSLTLAYNSGAAFSFLSDQGGWQRWFFVAIATVVSLMLVSWLRRMKAEESWQACAMALILGGALGNLYDRIVNGYVVDFLLVYYRDWYFPSFNLADVGITMGAGMLIIDMFRPQPRIEK